MNTISKKAKILRFSSLFLLTGAAFLASGCDINNQEGLFFTIKGKDLEVVFCDRGASIYSIKYKDQYVTYHPKNQDDFLKDDYYYGKCLGRVAGRIKDGDLTIDGTHYQLDVNEVGKEGTTSVLKHNNIHGGKDSFSSRNFKRFVTETDDFIRVSFSYVSPDMEAGFPGQIDTHYVYKVYKNESKLELDINATTDKNTVLNLSNHPYFRLSNEGNVLNHNLTLKNANKLAKFDIDDSSRLTNQVVTGELDFDSVTEIAPFDFRDGKLIGKDIAAAKAYDETSGGYDHIWKWDNGNTCDVTLTNPDSKISLNVKSDADAVIMYANCYPNAGLEMNPEGTDVKNGGITIEPIKFFTNDTVATDLKCTPDTPFTRNIVYNFTTVE